MAPLNVVVIGAGTLGMSTALSLTERGAAVTVIEAEAIAAGSSGRSVGVVGTQHVDPFEVLIRSHSVRRLREWRARGLAFNPSATCASDGPRRTWRCFAKASRCSERWGSPLHACSIRAICGSSCRT